MKNFQTKPIRNRELGTRSNGFLPNEAMRSARQFKLQSFPKLRNEAIGRGYRHPIDRSVSLDEICEEITKRTHSPSPLLSPVRRARDAVENYETKPCAMRASSWFRVQGSRFQRLRNEANGRGEWHAIDRSDSPGETCDKITKRTQPLMNRRFQDLRSQIADGSTVIDRRYRLFSKRSQALGAPVRRHRPVSGFGFEGFGLCASASLRLLKNYKTNPNFELGTSNLELHRQRIT